MAAADPTLTTAALASAEKIINVALTYDPATALALAKLAPQILAVSVTAPSFVFFVAPQSGGIRLLGHCEEAISTQVQGSLPALLALLKHQPGNLKDSGVEVIGSSHFLAELQQILKKLDIDWEEMLSQMFGDIIGHQGAQLIRSKLRWVSDRAANIQRLSGEFLTEELQALPSRAELAFFYSQVDELQLDVDRLTARIEQQLNKL